MFHWLKAELSKLFSVNGSRFNDTYNHDFIAVSHVKVQMKTTFVTVKYMYRSVGSCSSSITSKTISLRHMMCDVDQWDLLFLRTSSSSLMCIQIQPP